MPEHSILSQTTSWSLSGIYFDEHEKGAPVEGTLVSQVEDNSIVLKASVNFRNQNHFEINTVSEIKKTKISNTFEINSSISNIGKLEGRLMETEENLVFIFESPDKQYAGSEYMKMINNNFYKNRGIIYRGNQKFSSWSYEIRKKENDE